MFSATLLSLDKDKFHILGIDTGHHSNMDTVIGMMQEVDKLVQEKCPGIKLVILPFSLSGVDPEFLTKEDLKNVIKYLKENK